MKTLILIFSLLVSSQAFAAVPVTLNFNLPSAAYLTDVEQARFLQVARNSPEGTVGVAINTSATSLSISGVCPASNTAILVDQEPMLVTAGSGTSSCTVTRNSALAQANTSAAAHSIGAQVKELLYPTAQNFFIRVAVQNFMAEIIQGLAVNSAVNGTAVSAILTNQATANAAIAGAAQ